MPARQVAMPAGARLGMSPLAWTNNALTDLGDDIALETCLAETASFGFAGIELGRKFPRKAAALRAALAPHALELISGWWVGRLLERSVEAELDAVDAHAGLLAEFGCAVMVYGEFGGMTDAGFDAPFAASPRLDDAAMARYAAHVTTFAERLHAAFGLRLAYHHHLLMAVETAAECHAFYGQSGDAVGLLLDTGHAAAAGFDPMSPRVPRP